MRKLIAAAFAVFWAGAALAQSCTVVPVSPETGIGEISGYVLDGRPLCYFYDRATGTGEARLFAENACFTPEGYADCTRDFTFNTGANGFRFFVQQDQLMARHEAFTLRLTLY